MHLFQSYNTYFLSEMMFMHGKMSIDEFDVHSQKHASCNIL